MNDPKGSYGANSIYRFFFKDLQQDFDSEFKLTQKEYREIIYAFNKKLVDRILAGKVVELPYGLGEVRIKKKKLNVKYAAANLRKYQDTGIRSKFFNEHSDGFRARLYWRKEFCDVPGHYMFTHTFTRANKFRLSKIMQTPGEHKRYYE